MLRSYSIKDEKSSSFNTPFFALSDGVAIRQFMDLCNDAQSLVFKHPEDFSLWFLGTFDEVSGELKATERKHLIDATAFVADGVNNGAN